MKISTPKYSTLANLRPITIVRAVVVTALVGVIAVSCSTPIDVAKFGADFDDLCIAGKVKPTSAAWLNANQDLWKQHRDYTDLRGDFPLKADDRFFNGDCSSVTKELIRGNVRGSLEALERVKAGGIIDN